MRTERIDEDIKYCLDKIIREDLKNPKIKGVITVTTVKTTKDLKYSKVYVSIFGTKYTHQVFSELKNSAKYIRKCLGENLKLRIVPDLVFELDDSMEYGEYMDRLIDKVISEDENKE